MPLFRRRARRQRLPDPKHFYIPFTGGLDTETPKWNVPDGMMRSAQNYEIGIEGGYQDIVGYERYDGRPSPSDAIYTYVYLTITGSFTIGDVVDQPSSSAQGTVFQVITSESPAYLVLTKVAGTFDGSGDLEVSASVEGTQVDSSLATTTRTPMLQSQYKNLAADVYRADIGDVGGASASGSVLGVVLLDDIWYAFRNNAAGTACLLFKETASGWTEVALNNEISFTAGGTTAFTEGDTVTGGTSGANATILRVVLESGSWAGSDAAGRLVIGAVTAGPFQAEAITDAGGGSATCSGAESAITLEPDGVFEFHVQRIGGVAKRIYGSDGVNYGFEFDGTAFVQIHTGMVPDTPNAVRVHKNHLFFAFGPSLQHSGIGFPYVWSPVFGAAELAIGDTISGIREEPGAEGGSTLGVYSRNVSHMLYGSSSADWELVVYRDEIGALPRSIQQVSGTFFQDDRGITSLRTTQAFGNFAHSSISRRIQTHFNARNGLLVDSCIVREKNQYRLFYSDRSAYYITMEGNDVKGIAPILLGHTMNCVGSYEDSAGNEVIMMGATDGYVYQMEKGTSFDGADISAFMLLHFSQLKTLRYLKKYLGLTLEVEGEGYGEFNFSYELGYGDATIPQPSQELKTVDLSSVLWDSFNWDDFVWDGQNLIVKTNKLNGSAQNISLVFRKTSDYFYPIKISGALIRYQIRRMMRE